MILNKAQTNRIFELLKSRNNLRDEQIIEEMADHFCCLVEKKMVLGHSFEEAFNEVAEDLTPEETQQIERSAKHIQFKVRLKKKVKSISAVAATLILLLVAVADAQIKPEGSPLKGEHKITSSFGNKKHPETRNIVLHKGVDYKVGMGTPVYATADGVVSETQFANSGYGIKIVIDHQEEYQTLYAHLSEIITKRGQKVSKGDLIGYSGNSGRSSGPHLHYEVRKNGRNVNPQPYIDAKKK